MSESLEFSECKNVTRLSTKEFLLEALGVIGLIVLILLVLGAIGVVAFFFFFDLEYGLVFLLFGIGVTLGLGYIVIAISEFLRTSSPKFVRCSYCGMKNPADATFCIRCEKVLPKQKRRLPRPKTIEKI